jgi:CheY-like chemotaxis protein
MHYAINGLLAVKMARELRPALILMDIQMPVLDGLAAIREIRADPAMAATPIVALTALAMPGDRERCLSAGATDYMSKPVSLKALAEMVNRLAPVRLNAR